MFYLTNYYSDLQVVEYKVFTGSLDSIMKYHKEYATCLPKDHDYGPNDPERFDS